MMDEDYDEPHKFSADQHLAMAQHHLRLRRRLPKNDDVMRPYHLIYAKWFLARGRRAQMYDWSSSAIAPFSVLTEEEIESLHADPDLWRRVWMPTLTIPEKQSLRDEARESGAYFSKAFAHLRPKTD